MKHLFLDVETTGLNPQLHAIVQLSGIIEIDGVLTDTFDFNIKPHLGAQIDPMALETIQKTEDELNQYPEPYLVFEQFITLLNKYIDPYKKTDKFFFCAYNAPFDNEFVREFFRKNQSNFFGSYFWNPSLDIMVLAAEALKANRHTMPNFKLMTTAKTLGIEVDTSKLHDSLYDIELTREIYHLLNTPHDETAINKESPQTPTAELPPKATTIDKPQLKPMYDELF